VQLRQAPYDVVLGHGVLAELHELLPRRCPAATYVVITDSVVGPLYAHELAERIGALRPAHLLTFPAGERHKTRETWSRLTDEMLAAGVGRDAAILAVGGGVVGDVAGFVAATYLRGIPYIQVPTTLLAMIDSSVGGKTGVDTPEGKNLVGAFHQPSLVVSDTATLATLPAAHLAAGIAEAVKHGAIADAGYLQTLAARHGQIAAREAETLRDVVARSIEIKAAIVADDEREAGRRAVLNFGHTVGHAVEASTGYALMHGEAVAMGMVLEAELGTGLGVTEPGSAETLRATLERYQLPTQPPREASSDAILQAMRYDKKVRRQAIRCTLLRRPGEIARAEDGGWTHQVTEAGIRAILDPLLAGTVRTSQQP
jgi:3-dehydroquinate synthase